MEEKQASDQAGIIGCLNAQIRNLNAEMVDLRAATQKKRHSSCSPDVRAAILRHELSVGVISNAEYNRQITL